MKHEKAVVEKCVREIKNYLYFKRDYADVLLRKMGEVETISELMGLKKDLMNQITSMLPIGNMHCPFCVLHTFDCATCFYGKTNGKCEHELDSKYGQLSDAQVALKKAINQYWTDRNADEWKEFSTPKIKQVTSELELICGNKYFTTYHVNCSDEAEVPIERIFTATSIPYHYYNDRYQVSPLNGSLMVDFEEEKRWAKDGVYKDSLFLQDFGIPKPKYSDRRTWTYDESVKNMTWGELKKLIKI